MIVVFESDFNNTTLCDMENMQYSSVCMHEIQKIISQNNFIYAWATSWSNIYFWMTLYTSTSPMNFLFRANLWEIVFLLWKNSILRIESIINYYWDKYYWKYKLRFSNNWIGMMTTDGPYLVVPWKYFSIIGMLLWIRHYICPRSMI